ncbi:MAG: hypothetical protein KA712_24570 [Myxococcales bacterium]|nr:hypothetical protein [Myxococcales bacterium]
MFMDLSSVWDERRLRRSMVNLRSVPHRRVRRLLLRPAHEDRNKSANEAPEVSALFTAVINS